MRTNKRKSIVFWETLKTYKGAVILTTSRSVKFDEVVLSRITFPIHYAAFDSETRQQVGTQELRRLQEDRGDFTIEPEARELWKLTLGEVDWNGHEIRSGKQSSLHNHLMTNLFHMCDHVFSYFV